MPPKLLHQGISLAELSSKVQGKIIGDPNAKVMGVCALSEPRPGHISFTRETKALKLKATLDSSPLIACIVCNTVELSAPIARVNLLLVPDPLQAITALIPYFFEPYELPKSSSTALIDIHPTAQIGRNTTIGAFSSIGAFARIGDNVVIYPHVTIYPGAQIGNNTIIHAGAVIREDCIIGDSAIIQNGAVIGADGFGYVPDSKLGLAAIPQIGTVELAARVEVGANTCIDRATLGKTTVDTGTKIDNLVQVGHNTHIGKFAILCGQVGIAGSATIGDKVTLGGGAGVADHVTIAEGCRIAARAGVIADISEKGDYGGFPAIPFYVWKRMMFSLSRVPQRLRKLERLISKEDE